MKSKLAHIRKNTKGLEVLNKKLDTVPAALPKQRIDQALVANPDRLATLATVGLISPVNPVRDILEWPQVMPGQRGVYLNFEDGGAGGVVSHPARIATGAA